MDYDVRTEETMEEKRIDIPKGYEFAGVDDDKQQVVFTKIQLEYPKTYEACCKELTFEDMNRLKPFIRLLRCRNAYWKIKGNWKPGLRFGKKKYCIMTKNNKVIYATAEETNRILAFPTSEMRDEFHKNFKELIEECKEFL